MVAYNYGPVVESIFREYRTHGRDNIEQVEDDVFEILVEEMAVTHHS
ncbi:hypothetical protein [Geomicrobium sp. JCM 19037]|nr:hypothetical protein [Geomicrobium sp. JCM 19037]